MRGVFLEAAYRKFTFGVEAQNIMCTAASNTEPTFHFLFLFQVSSVSSHCAEYFSFGAARLQCVSTGVAERRSANTTDSEFPSTKFLTTQFEICSAQNQRRGVPNIASFYYFFF